MRTKLLFIGIVILTLILFLPSFNMFFTNDDFFLLKISKANNISEFINFFNFTKGPDGLGMYRPLTIQVFYFLAHALFNLNPFPMHIIVFIVFTILLYSIFLLAKKLFGYLKVRNSDISSLLVVFLYAVSATHFGHMYYLATFQEVVMTLFSVTSVYLYLLFLEGKKTRHAICSLIMFVLALLSKENAVVIPGLLLITYLFRQRVLKEKIILINLIKQLIPFAFVLSVYLYFHFFVYGLATGDSYVWNFSFRKVVNTLMWYLLWSLNIPEMFVDFIGPGFNINPNLMKYWANETVIILSGFVLTALMLLYAFYKSLKDNNIKLIILFSGMGFIISLISVLFLPIHKFTFYLTLPLFWIIFATSYVLNNINRLFIIIFLIAWIFTSIKTLDLTYKTHWIVRSQDIALKVHNYINNNYEDIKGKTIVFVDTKEDEQLPWSPTQNIKHALSDSNYFSIYDQHGIYIEYGYLYPIVEDKSKLYILNSRIFIGY